MWRTRNTRTFHSLSHFELIQYLLLVDFAELVKQKEMMLKTLMVKQLEIAKQHSSFIHTVSHHFNEFFYQKYILRVHQTNFGVPNTNLNLARSCVIAVIQKNVSFYVLN